MFSSLSQVSAYEESSILAHVAEGDEIAFRKLYDLYRDKLFFIAFKITRDESSSEDVVQEVFIKLWLNRQKLLELDSLAAYLNSITRNHIFSQLRKLATEEVYLRDLINSHRPESKDGSDQVLYNELKKMLDTAVARLPPQQKTVYQLGKIEGKKYDEIASLLNISKETVKNHMTKATASIKAYLGDHQGLLALTILVIRSL
jgi:RNA polymerase sigma-70 factor (ECF subfamily)